jgi:hypothetical protein
MIRLSLTIAFALSLSTYLSSISVAQAEPIFAPSANKQNTLPPQRGNPDDTEQAVTRSIGACGQAGVPLTPMLPKTATASSNEFSGYTLTGHPTFWFYIPYETRSVNRGEFVIENEQGEAETVWKVDFKMPKTPGLVKVSIPPTAKPLEVNKTYRWNMIVHCNSEQASNQSYVFETGIVQRIDDPALQNQLNAATPEEKLAVYANRRVWYDATTNLAQVRQSPQWSEFLRSIGLEPLSRAAIAGSIVPTAGNR